MSSCSLETVAHYTALQAPQQPEELLAKLIKAVRRDDPELVALWTRRGASVIAKDHLGNSALHIAVMIQCVGAVQALLAAGAAALDKNLEGRSALEIADDMGLRVIVRLLDQSLQSAPKQYVSEIDLNKSEFALLNAIMNVAPEEDPISTELLSIKAALRPKKRKPDLEKLLQKIKQPWTLYQHNWKGRSRREDVPTNSLSQHYVVIQTLSAEIQGFIDTLAVVEKNKKICASLEKIRTSYQAFIATCCGASPAARQALLKGRVCLKGAKIGCRYLNSDAVPRILAGKPPDQPGNHTANAFNGIHWKQSPSASGIEQAVMELVKLVFHCGSPPTMLLNIIKADGTTLPVLASQTIQGECLEKVMKEHPEWLNQLDMTNFSMMTFLGFLVDPYDGKPDNFMVAVERDLLGIKVEKLLLSSIDNDLSLSDVFVRSDGRKELIVEVLYALFVFPQMHKPVDRAFREQFLRLLPEEIVIEWLKAMIKQNELYQELRSKKVFTVEEFQKLQLPFALRPYSAGQEGFVEALYRKICSLQQALSENEKITHWQLFQLVSPLVARVYERRLQQYEQEVPEAERSLFQSYMRIHSSNNIEDLLLSGELSPSPDGLQRAAFDPYQQLQKAGNKYASRTLSPEEALGRFMPLIPWSRYSTELQLKWLHSIATVHQLKEVTFCNLEMLDDMFLTRTLTGFPELASLTLFGCPQVTGSGLFGLLKEKPHLRLILGDCPGLEGEDYDKLTRNQLSIQFASGLPVPVAPGSTQLLHAALREKNEQMIFFALRSTGPADTTALLIVAQFDDLDFEIAKQWLAALFFCKAIPDQAVLEALSTKPALKAYFNRLQSKHMQVVLEAQRQQAKWIDAVPWHKYGQK